MYYYRTALCCQLVLAARLKTARRTLGPPSLISSLCPCTHGLVVPVCVPAAAALAVEDFVWGVSTAMPAMHSFLVINRGRQRATKYSQKQPTVWRVLFFRSPLPSYTYYRQEKFEKATFLSHTVARIACAER